VSAFAAHLCARCGYAAHPPRLLCPRCAAAQWRVADAAGGTVEEVTAVDGTPLAAVRTDLGPRVIARAAPGLRPGDRVKLSVDDDAATTARRCARAVAASRP
jgi:uncharacterized OB-fold protein